LELAREFAGWVEESADFERLAPAPFTVVCFRANPKSLMESGEDRESQLNSLNEQIMEEVNRRGKVYLSHTKLRGKLTLRLAIGNIRTQREHVELAWDELNTVLAEVSHSGSSR
jgi:aromatic-L-amino-acid decarboxylase